MHSACEVVLGQDFSGGSESGTLVTNNVGSWWSTLPRFVKGLTTLVVALTGLVAGLTALYREFRPKPVIPVSKPQPQQADQTKTSQKPETDDLIELHSWNDGNGNEHAFTVDGMPDPDPQQFNRDGTQWFVYSMARSREPNLRLISTCLARNGKHRLTIFPRTDCREAETPLGLVAVHPTVLMKDKLLSCTNPANGNHSASVEHCAAGDHPSDLGFYFTSLAGLIALLPQFNADLAVGSE